MEAVKLASETVTVTMKPSLLEVEEEASLDVAAAVMETDDGAAVAAKLRCSNMVRFEVPRVRIPRIA